MLLIVKASPFSWCKIKTPIVTNTFCKLTVYKLYTDFEISGQDQFRGRPFNSFNGTDKEQIVVADCLAHFLKNLLFNIVFQFFVRFEKMMMTIMNFGPLKIPSFTTEEQTIIMFSVMMNTISSLTLTTKIR